MPPGDPTLPDPAVQAVLAYVVQAVREKAAAPPILLSNDEAAKFVGVSRAAWFRLRSADEVPAAVNVPGVGPKFRRADLEKWAAGLKHRRRKGVARG